MIINRVPPFPLTAKINDVVSGQTYKIIDSDGQEINSGEVSGSILTISVPSQYDTDISVEIYDGENLFKEVSIFIVRPYIDLDSVISLGQVDSIEEAQKLESIARSIIDSITGGFYLTQKTYETFGSNTNRIPIPYRINKLLKVYENGALIFENGAENNQVDFTVSKDKRDIVVVGYDTYDHIIFGRSRPLPEEYEYIIEIESGWTKVPPAIAQATQIIISDIVSEEDYVSKYIAEYSTDQYSVKFSPQIFTGTGNKTIDTLLRPFRNSYIQAGIM